MSAMIIRLLLIPTLLLTLNAAAAEKLNEDAIKVDFLLQLSKFIYWSNTLTERAPIKLCLFATTPAKARWNRIHQEISQKHEIQLHYINQDHQLTECTILFVHKLIPNNVIQKNYYALISNNILTVGEKKNFAKEGGIIELGFSENRTDITINLRAATEAGISIHANLIEIASTVYTQGQR